jgi:hypothetical protein
MKIAVSNDDLVGAAFRLEVPPPSAIFSPREPVNDGVYVLAESRAHPNDGSR